MEYIQHYDFGVSIMTAIGIFGIRQGFLIGADGRVTLDDESRATASQTLLVKETSTAQKIFPIDTPDMMGAYALAGTIGNDELSLDLVDEAKREALHLSQRNFADPIRFIKKFAADLAEVITQAKHFPEQETRAYGWMIVEIFFVGYFKREPFVTHVAFYHRARQSAAFQLESMPLKGFLYGSEIVRKAMYDDHGALRNSPLSEHIQGPNTIARFDDAERYVKGYIEACSSSLALEMDEAGCKKIGGHIHVAEITPNGFRWRIPPIQPISPVTAP